MTTSGGGESAIGGTNEKIRRIGGSKRSKSERHGSFCYPELVLIEFEFHVVGISGRIIGSRSVPITACEDGRVASVKKNDRS